MPSGGPIRILLIDDDPLFLELGRAALCSEDVLVDAEIDAARGLERYHKCRPDIVVTDLLMEGISGLEVLDRIRHADPETDVVLITAHYSTDSAVDAIQRGASDYISKPVTIERLRERIGRLVGDVRAKKRNRCLEKELTDASRFEGMVGRSSVMREVFGRIRRVAPHFRTILVTGPTGGGKELVARALHRLSPVANQPFIVCNCAAVAEQLVESELFGYVKGAFTGAFTNKTGLFEAADGGVVFLDEISEMSVAAQAKLLRVIQNLEIQPVGSAWPRKINVRVIAATNRDLREACQEKRFREDLFFRLSSVKIAVPSLAGRKEDLPLLWAYFINRAAAEYGKPIAGLSPEAEAALMKHDWPGNVRELENAIASAAILTDSERLGIEDFAGLFPGPASAAAAGLYPAVSLDEIRKIHVRRVLSEVRGDKRQAMDMLGVSRSTLYRLLKDAYPGQDPDALT